MKRTMIMTVLLALAARPALAQQAAMPAPPVVSISASGSVTRQPDRAVINVAVESRATTAQAASQANAQKMDAVFAALRRLGIVAPNVQTVSYGLNPEYSQPDPRSGQPYTPRIVGYTAINMLRVQYDSVARVGAVIDAVITAGANRIDGLSFELRDPESARLEALRKAVATAQLEADAIATAAGQRLGKPLNISTSSGYEPRPMYRVAMQAADMAAPPAPTPVEAGSLTVVASVNITYKLEDR